MARWYLALGVACSVLVAGCGAGDDTASSFAAASADGGGSDATGGGMHHPDATASDARPDSAADATVSDSVGPEGDGAVAATFPSAPIDLGAVGCSQFGSHDFTIVNNGHGDLAISASTTGLPFTVLPPNLTITPGASGTLTITAQIPGSSTAGTKLHGSLTLFTNDPSRPSESIDLSATPSGATVTFAPSSPTSATFPSTEVGYGAAPITLSFINTGNAPANISFSAPSDPQFSLFGVGDGGTSVMLSPGGTLGETAEYTPSGAAASTSVQSTIQVSGVTCGSSVTSINYVGAVGVGHVEGWPTGPIDFGPADCGGAPPANKFFVLTNSGSIDATITKASIAGAPGFTVIGQGGLIQAGGSFGVTVHAPPVPSPSPTTPITATLTVVTDAEPTPHTITLTEEPRGAALSFDTSQSPNFGSFGPAVLLQPIAQNFNVTNTGNAPAIVTLAATGGSGGSAGPAFTLSNSAFTLQANGVQTDSAFFVPTVVGDTTGALTLTATGTLCAAGPSPLPLSGTGVGGGPSITPTSLTFPANCGGAAPPPQTFTVRNNGAANLNWSMSSVTGAGHSQYAVSASPAPGLLMPGQSSTVTVSAAAIPSPAPNPTPSANAAQLIITTDVPFDDPHVVTLGEIPLGDQLSVSLSNLRFGQFPINTSTIAQSFTVTNSANPGSPAANLTLSVSGSGASAYSIAPGTIANLAPGGGVSGAENVIFKPSSAVPYPATVSLSTSDGLCSALPSAIQLIGTGTQGKVSVSATTLAFGTDASDPNGLVNCGATGLSHTFTVANMGNQQFKITKLSLGLGASSPYVVSGDASTLPTTIPIGGSATIIVTPKAIPAAVQNPNDPAPFTDTLTVTTDAVLDAPHKVALVMQARGAVITNTPLATTWDVGTLGNGRIGTFATTITNTGNAGASIAFAGLANPTVFGLQSSPTVVAPNAVTDVVGQFSPPATNQLWIDQGSLVVTPAQAFCEPLPGGWSSPVVHLSGSSISGSLPVTVSGNLAFPTTDCGSAGPAGQSITLTNTTNIPYVFTAALSSGVFYTLQNPTQGDASAGIIPGHGVVVLGVTPQTVTPGLTVVAGSAPYADNLVIAIQSQTPSGVTIPISWTLNGAMLSLPQGQGPNKDTAGNSFYVADTQSGLTLPMDNSGTATASVQFGVQPAGAFTFVPAPPIAVEPSIRALPRLSGASSSATCPSLTPGSATFLYTGPVCRPFPFPQVRIQSCVGAF